MILILTRGRAFAHSQQCAIYLCPRSEGTNAVLQREKLSVSLRLQSVDTVRSSGLLYRIRVLYLQLHYVDMWAWSVVIMLLRDQSMQQSNVLLEIQEILSSLSVLTLPTHVHNPEHISIHRFLTCPQSVERRYSIRWTEHIA